jgi:hypothetical protein
LGIVHIQKPFTYRKVCSLVFNYFPYKQMIVEPEQRVADFIKAGADIVSVHAETAATIHLHRTINLVGFQTEFPSWHLVKD